MKIALFDLDHTLLPFDSGMAWLDFLVQSAEIPVEAGAHYLECCQQYVAGQLGVEALHRACWEPSRSWTMARLTTALNAFASQLADRVPPRNLSLVRHHRDAGHVCVLATATSTPIALACARLFGISEVLATKARSVHGVPTGEIDGQACHGAHKLQRVRQWLSSLEPDAPTLETLEASWFYSDSASDLPLLESVTHPVAVNPDPRLRAHANTRNWLVLQDQPSGPTYL